MRYASAAAFQQALTDQIKNEARRTNRDHQRLRQLVAFERLLARLTEFAAEVWILKGGLALDIRLGSRARTTKDMDLAWRAPQETAEAAFRKIERHRADDHFGFQIARTTLLDEADVGGTVRYLVRCLLGGRLYAPFHLDINFDGPILGDPEELAGPTLLAFTDIPPITVPVLRLAQHVAEKVHAYTGTYGPLNRPSTRVKDLVDLVLIQASETLVAGEVQAALKAVFSLRESHPVPTTLPPPPSTHWPAQYRRMAASLDIPTNLSEGYRLAAAFLDPILAGHTTDAQVWNPERAAWAEAPQA